MSKNINIDSHHTAVVDDEDVEKVSGHSWRIVGRDRGPWYAMCQPNQKGLYMHHLIAGTPPKGMTIDHINGNSLDNRKENLRVATQQQQRMNSAKRVDGASRYKGVIIRNVTGRCKKTRICAQIKALGRSIYLGDFETEEEAAEAYNKAAVQYFGEFARVNSL